MLSNDDSSIAHTNKTSQINQWIIDVINWSFKLCPSPAKCQRDRRTKPAPHLHSDAMNKGNPAGRTAIDLGSGHIWFWSVQNYVTDSMQSRRSAYVTDEPPSSCACQPSHLPHSARSIAKQERTDSPQFFLSVTELKLRCRMTNLISGRFKIDDGIKRRLRLFMWRNKLPIWNSAGTLKHIINICGAPTNTMIICVAFVLFLQIRVSTANDTQCASISLDTLFACKNMNRGHGSSSRKIFPFKGNVKMSHHWPGFLRRKLLPLLFSIRGSFITIVQYFMVSIICFCVLTWCNWGSANCLYLSKLLYFILCNHIGTFSIVNKHCETI